jgi:hypothetical protein
LPAGGGTRVGRNSVSVLRRDGAADYGFV